MPRWCTSGNDNCMETCDMISLVIWCICRAHTHNFIIFFLIPNLLKYEHEVNRWLKWFQFPDRQRKRETMTVYGRTQSIVNRWSYFYLQKKRTISTNWWRRRSRRRRVICPNCIHNITCELIRCDRKEGVPGGNFPVTRGEKSTLTLTQPHTHSSVESNTVWYTLLLYMMCRCLTAILCLRIENAMLGINRKSIKSTMHNVETSYVIRVTI